LQCDVRLRRAMKFAALEFRCSKCGQGFHSMAAFMTHRMFCRDRDI
jgi:hypothetical protein